jgi:hypothetical protein
VDPLAYDDALQDLGRGCIPIALVDGRPGAQLVHLGSFQPRPTNRRHLEPSPRERAAYAIELTEHYRREFHPEAQPPVDG